MIVNSHESTARSKVLGAELRRWRERAGIEAREVAHRLSWSRSKVSHMERGTRGVSELDATKYLGVCRTPGADIDDVLEFFHETEGLWAQLHPQLLSDELRGQITLETSAREIHSLQLLVLPGLLQTEDYIRALITECGIAKEERIETLVRVRKDRQVLLRRHRPPAFRFFIHENPLRMMVGDAHTMNDQLLHLVFMSSRPHISIRVIPESVGVHANTVGPFTLMDYDLPRSVVSVDTLTTTLFIDRKRAVAGHRDALRQVESIALDQGESRSWLANLANEFDRPREDS
ncbi:helix-turn-helix protein [Herbihabitans rhizosphaerae]|uniref:Helix-turn-helix protein n=1 Tax=Herbihabitans rhizosphaerae TaxID=1872711 RepID=A0A4Q7L583_9PSEU|nr:helix-turn-helix transcriptional regulator [Herbihabitans rhizosphaerae]RZS44424.1 helix-turn-helix protein [Herbihabitans rhizosphaerae]